MAKDKTVKFPYAILVDTAEGHPWTFQGIKTDSDKGYRTWVVETRHVCLGRHPRSLGDYSLDGFEGEIHFERKSVEDCQGTILGWPYQDEHGNYIDGTGRRARFESELANLETIPWSAVIVEGTMADVWKTVQPHNSRKEVGTLRKILFRSVCAYQQDYKVPWFFCESRREAELTCFRMFERFVRKKKLMLRNAR